MVMVSWHAMNTLANMLMIAPQTPRYRLYHTALFPMDPNKICAHPAAVSIRTVVPSNNWPNHTALPVNPSTTSVSVPSTVKYTACMHAIWARSRCASKADVGRNVDARVAAAGVRVRGVPVANRASEASGGIVRVWCARSYCPMCAFSVSYVHGNVLARTACKKYYK